MAPTEPGSSLHVAFEHADLSLFALWMRYVGLGGTRSLHDLDAHLWGTENLDSVQHDTLVQALNERFMERDMNHPVPYARS